jgi:hypothetical protein
MQGVLGPRSGRPAADDHRLPKHSGPAFRPWWDWRCRARAAFEHIRDLVMGAGRERKAATGMFGRLIAAMRGGF